MANNDESIIREIVARMRTARRLFFITGAGISADSGLPTYRGIGGLYNNQLTEEDIPIEVALSGQMLAANPEITWKYLFQIESACRGAGFNAAHRIIAELQDYCDTVCVLTQNVDGFHRTAGSRNLIEIHGHIHDLSCMNCGYQCTVPDYRGLHIPPPCPRCGSLLRPDVVLFGEYLPPGATERLYQQLAEGFDLVFSIGTTSIFPYIAAPVLEARRRGIPTVEINPGETAVSQYVEFKLSDGAVASMQRIWNRFRGNAST